MTAEGSIDSFPYREFRDSRAFLAVVGVAYGAVAAGFAAAGWPVLACAAMVGVGWAGYRMVSTQVRLRISEEGIEDRSYWYTGGLIAWDEILDVRAGPWGSIEIDLRDEAAHWQRLSPLRQIQRAKLQMFYRLGPAAIIPWGLEGSRPEVLEALQEGLDTVELESFIQNREIEPPSSELL